jgi:transcription antitermination protein NusB
LRACLRAGAFELADRTDVPVKVVLNEYVELAFLFFDSGEPAFVNAVLDRLATVLRAAESGP